MTEKLTEKHVSNWMAADAIQTLTGEEIIDMVADPEDDTDEVQEEVPDQMFILHSDGFETFTDALNCVAEQEKYAAAYMSFLHHWCDLAAQKHAAAQKQRRITFYFQPMQLR
ncbi:uncharacterized protein [Bemisia tabaci]